jgi:branched-chain amino acid transport system permease protein
VLVAPLFMINPAMGETPLLIAFMVIILGGIGSVTGAVVGGLVIGLIESFGSFLIGPAAASGMLFALVILIILFKPTGIIGRG